MADLIEERATVKAEYGDNAEWEGFLESMDAQIDHMVDVFQITPEEQAKPQLVKYWGTPFKLTKRESKCRTFLQFLETSFYKDVSAHAQLTFAGMQKISAFLMADLLGDSVPEGKRKRAMQSLHFRQMSRTADFFLAVATEIDTFIKLGNHSTIDYLWVIFSEHAVEAREMYEFRYQSRVR